MGRLPTGARAQETHRGPSTLQNLTQPQVFCGREKLDPISREAWIPGEHCEVLRPALKENGTVPHSSGQAVDLGEVVFLGRASQSSGEGSPLPLHSRVRSREHLQAFWSNRAIPEGLTGALSWAEGEWR